MTIAADILVAAAGRIGSALGWASVHAVEIVGAIAAWAVVSAWVITGGARRD